MRKIIDKFTKLPISRQQKYRLRKQRKGICLVCEDPAVTTVYCLRHAIKQREYMRKRKKCKIRFKGAKTYRMENSGK